jgi:hypothetical protein
MPAAVRRAPGDRGRGRLAWSGCSAICRARRTGAARGRRADRRSAVPYRSTRPRAKVMAVRGEQREIDDPARAPATRAACGGQASRHRAVDQNPRAPAVSGGMLPATCRTAASGRSRARASPAGRPAGALDPGVRLARPRHLSPTAKAARRARRLSLASARTPLALVHKWPEPRPDRGPARRDVDASRGSVIASIPRAATPRGEASASAAQSQGAQPQATGRSTVPARGARRPSSNRPGEKAGPGPALGEVALRGLNGRTMELSP